MDPAPTAATWTEAVCSGDLERFSRVLADRVFRADLTMMVYEGATQTVTFLSLALFLWIGGMEVLDGDLPLGELVSFNALVLLANAPIAIVLLRWDSCSTRAFC